MSACIDCDPDGDCRDDSGAACTCPCHEDRPLCTVLREQVSASERGAAVDAGLDWRSEPEDDPLDRVCCRCGESVASDGRCWRCAP